MGKRNRNKAALNNPHIRNSIKASLTHIKQNNNIRNIEYFEDGIKFTHENGNISYYFY